MTLKEKILAAKDSKLFKHYVPEWDCEVWTKDMSGCERDDWEAELRNNDGKIDEHNFRARFLVKCLCDSDGVRLFQDNEVEQLGAKSITAIDPLYEAARKQNKLRKADEDELKKSSSPEATDSSTSD